MTKPIEKWRSLNGISKIVIALISIILVIGSGLLAIVPYVDLPDRVAELEAVEHRQNARADSLAIHLDRMDDKLDRVICILEGNPPLTCERQGRPSR